MTNEQLLRLVSTQPYPLFLMTLSGSHLYGFASPNSDYDLRGVYILPLKEVIGLYEGRDTIETTIKLDGQEIDLVMYDIKKFLALLLKKNGLILEQIYSPVLVQALPELEELKDIARKCISRHHKHHYYGYAQDQWKLLNRSEVGSIKNLLHVYRVLLTGLHLLRSGEVETNLLCLGEMFQLTSLPDLIARKQAGGQKAVLDKGEIALHRAEYERLLQELEQAASVSTLPEGATLAEKRALNDLLIRLRLQYSS
ncbi:nucleotidyltransferase [Ktedonosporobacter rubrisoli]|uniref:Nucleotidyltransferase n=1 Tax=Ktedonosporobacter rubrisoli TaxID=2509675 RepID=A0A4P6K4F6_KTERU|nr:nucleotidyltransferase domain-containing protein [Ktedonosporobacter rubrisoli]QBD83197.1 nucleotidyltransferase [Ktedonosporobacter rubrisoli]